MYNQIKQKKKLEAVRVHTCEQDGTCVCVSEKAQAVTCGVAAQLRLLTLMSNRDFASSFTANSLPPKVFWVLFFFLVHVGIICDRA